ncbi:MAG TPA: hypothetical protein DCR93_05085 [Cytophagales bacterium]|nr:hypothetical protein [Cytophagales bacterium]HAP58890.1 hypothetical protein [Cytophagales bacterium]
MDTENYISGVPPSISFSKKVLVIPSLEEIGVPPDLGGLGWVSPNPELDKNRLTGGNWVNRGDVLLTYSFQSFNPERANFFQKITNNIPVITDSWKILSPASGLVIDSREEYTSESNSVNHLVYHYVNRPMLPILLIPDDEPPPSQENQYLYMRLVHWLIDRFLGIPFRNNDRTKLTSLGKKIQTEEWSKENYPKFLEQLKNINTTSIEPFRVKEIAKNEGRLLANIQNLESKYHDLKAKLAYISREFGESE